MGSLPSWECGLKSQKYGDLNLIELSLPSWECGLKLSEAAQAANEALVTPFLGVWIEIVNAIKLVLNPGGHSLLGSVD